MGELRTIFLTTVVSAGPDTVYESLLVDKKMRVKKILLLVDGISEAGQAGTAAISKQKEMPSSKDRGVLAYLDFQQNYAATGGLTCNDRVVFVDFSPDYVEIEEDDYLHLIVNVNLLSAKAFAIIYYED